MKPYLVVPPVSSISAANSIGGWAGMTNTKFSAWTVASKNNGVIPRLSAIGKMTATVADCDMMSIDANMISGTTIHVLCMTIEPTSCFNSTRLCGLSKSVEPNQPGPRTASKPPNAEEPIFVAKTLPGLILQKAMLMPAVANSSNITIRSFGTAVILPCSSIRGAISGKIPNSKTSAIPRMNTSVASLVVTEKCCSPCSASLA